MLKTVLSHGKGTGRMHPDVPQSRIIRQCLVADPSGLHVSRKTPLQKRRFALRCSVSIRHP